MNPLKDRPEQATRDGDHLFVGKRGRLTPQGLEQLWKVAVQRAGLPRGLSIHCAPHTMAVHLLRKTRNLRQVQKQLGHASPATTANMYADVSFEDMRAGVAGLYGDHGENEKQSGHRPVGA
jgi:site-specific recombinase XerD